jgi:hypothetical protein
MSSAQDFNRVRLVTCTRIPHHGLEPAACSGPQFDAAVIRVDETTNDGEAQTGGAGVFSGAPEAVERVLTLLRRESRAFVGDAKFGLPRRDGDRASRRRGLEPSSGPIEGDSKDD